jgi:predicted thioesterase
MPAKPGLTASVDMKVTEADTAIALRSGSVPVLATPRVIALCEEASVLAAGSSPAMMSVGMRVQIDHVQPLPSGPCTAGRLRRSRACLTFTVRDARGLIAAGRVTRVVVDVERFLEKAH